MKNNKYNLLLALVLLLLMINSTFAYDYIIKINETELPYSGDFSFDVEGFNETININYGGFLSGQDSIEFTDKENKTIQVQVDVPFDVIGYEYISMINLTNNISYTVQFQIIDDVYFDLITDEICFVDTVQEIIPEAPLNSIVMISINGENISWSGEHIISYTPQNTGYYEVIADFSYRDNVQQIKKNFTVYQMISCTINANDVIVTNETISFSAGINGGIGDTSYLWNFEGGGESVNETPSQLYSEPGEYSVELTVTDDLNYKSTCSKMITVNERLYDLVIILADNETGNSIGDANVTLNNTLKKSNVDGKAKYYDISEGEYEIEIIKQGYDNYFQNITVSSDKTMYINLSKIPEDKKPVPQIELLNPSDGHITEDDYINFNFRVSSQTQIDYCYLLFNERSNLGYKIKGEIISPESGKDYSFNLDLTNGEFKWNIQCENKDGIGQSDDRYLFVRGLIELEKKTEDTIQKEEESIESEFDVDLSGFLQTITDISDFNKDIISSSNSIRDVFDILEFQSVLDVANSDIKKLKQDMINLQGLSISSTDKERKKNEILGELKKIRSNIPKDIIIIDELMYDIDTENNNVTKAIDEYLQWKEYDLSKGEYKKFSKKVKEVQKELGVHTTIRNIQIEFLNGEKRDYGIISKEVYTEPVPGGIFLEIIPKSIAQTVNSLEFSVIFEVVNKDPIVRIYTSENNKFSYYVQQKIDMEKLKNTDSVLVLDLNHPQNKITGFSILDTSTGTGKFFFIIILIGVIISGNYFIFFRDKDVRGKFVENFKNASGNFKIRSADEKLMILLDNIIDQLNLGKTKSALSKYSTVLELYDMVDSRLQQELKPIIEHLFFELEVFNMNIMINDAFSKTINGKWYEAVDTYNNIHDNLTYIPARFKNKIDKKLNRLNLSMDIHMMKSHKPSLKQENSIDDSLYGARK